MSQFRKRSKYLWWCSSIRINGYHDFISMDTVKSINLIHFYHQCHLKLLLKRVKPDLYFHPNKFSRAGKLLLDGTESSGLEKKSLKLKCLNLLLKGVNEWVVGVPTVSDTISLSDVFIIVQCWVTVNQST